MFKKVAFLLGIALIVAVYQIQSVRAQHIVTEDEASRLTLAALTAPPIVHRRSASRYAYSSYKGKKSYYRTVSYKTQAHKRQSWVRNIAYKHKPTSKFAIRNAVYKESSRHKRVAHRRHS